MFRSRFLSALLILFFLLPSHVAAQGASNEPVDWASLAEDGDISVNRTFEVDQGGTSGLFDGSMIQLYMIGIVHATKADARVTYNVTDDYLLASFRADAEDQGFTSDDPQSVEIDPIGEQSEAWNIESSMGSRALKLNFSLVIIQQDSWVQVLTGAGFGEVQVDGLVDIANSLIDRWPNTEPVTADQDGMRTGGPWAMAPQQDDLPSALEWVERADSGPEVTTANGANGGQARDGSLPDSPVALPGSIKGAETPTPAPREAESGSRQDTDTATPAAEAPAAESASTPAPGDAAPTAAPPERLLPVDPVPVTLWIILPAGMYEPVSDAACVGAGSYDSLRPGGVVSLLNQSGGTHIESAMLEANGTIYFDTVVQQDVCAFNVAFNAVPPGVDVLVDIDRVVLGQFLTNASPTDSGEPARYEIVVGQ